MLRRTGTEQGEHTSSLGADTHSRIDSYSAVSTNCRSSSQVRT
jgi:hypothetical protein